jgi:hypothetical protein
MTNPGTRFDSSSSDVVAVIAAIAALLLAIAGATACGASAEPGGDPDQRGDVAACEGLRPVDGALPAGSIEGNLVFFFCPREPNTPAPSTCAIGIQRDGGLITGLLLAAGEDTLATDRALGCLDGQHVAVQTKGPLSSADEQRLREILADGVVLADQVAAFGGLVAPRADAGACDDIPTIAGPKPPGHAQGELLFQGCPRAPGAAEPFTCAIVIERDDGTRSALMGIDRDTEEVLGCVAGEEVTVRTTGLLEQHERNQLDSILDKAGLERVEDKLRWGGWIGRRGEDPACAAIPVLDGAIEPGQIEGTLELGSCLRAPMAAEPFSCAIVIRRADGRRTGLMMEGGDATEMETLLPCVVGDAVAVRTSGVLEPGDQQMLASEVQRHGAAPVDDMLRWNGELLRVPEAVPPAP